MSIDCSIVIPTLPGRSSELADCLSSVYAQEGDYSYEIIKVTEEGPLAKLRNQGAARARGTYIAFIDDDVALSPTWLKSVIQAFQTSPDIAGVSGPSVIRPEFRKNRDIFRFVPFKFLYDLIFCAGQSHLPGHVTRSGAWTTGACNHTCRYEGPVHFLEACNMVFRASVFRDCGGFDETFLGVGDWSEPDLSFRIRQLGYELWFSRNAALEHRPSKSGAYKKRRKDAPNRLANYFIFAKRWIKPCFEHELYKIFLRIYYALKTA